MRHIVHANPQPPKPAPIPKVATDYEFATHSGSDLPKRPEPKKGNRNAGDAS